MPRYDHYGDTPQAQSIVCHHCRRSRPEIKIFQYADHSLPFGGIYYQEPCDCSEWWLRHQLELGLTPVVRVYDRGWEVTY